MTDDNEDAQLKSNPNKGGPYPEPVTRQEKIQKATAARKKALDYAANVPKPRSRSSEESEEEEQQQLDNDHDGNESSKLDNLMRKHRLDQERLKVCPPPTTLHYTPACLLLFLSLLKFLRLKEFVRLFCFAGCRT